MLTEFCYLEMCDLSGCRVPPSLGVPVFKGWKVLAIEEVPQNPIVQFSGYVAGQIEPSCQFVSKPGHLVSNLMN